MTTNTITHEDYADEAESAQRGPAWPQAAKLWRLAAACCLDPQRVERYNAQAAECDGEIVVDQKMADIARRTLGIPTLETRRSDRLDFHEVGVGQVMDALRSAYQAGRDAR